MTLWRGEVPPLLDSSNRLSRRVRILPARGFQLSGPLPILRRPGEGPRLRLGSTTPGNTATSPGSVVPRVEGASARRCGLNAECAHGGLSLPSVFKPAVVVQPVVGRRAVQHSPSEEVVPQLGGRRCRDLHPNLSDESSR